MGHDNINALNSNDVFFKMTHFTNKIILNNANRETN